ncbi:hypothetical protein J2Z69_002190 [Paenibacillus shirakamiensis]|uniref:Uncharacterized protein n=1 Tax=Paenibacillus shirakamiensis TaxID=1265935 RepID=A0ABS4JHE5_9BACL|nr:hypothetical protein [Paenibacillus shirakamiensis]MBP2001147.1 hypothetical protein [Paenibacillus shirakamiensis]
MTPEIQTDIPVTDLYMDVQDSMDSEKKPAFSTVDDIIAYYANRK